MPNQPRSLQKVLVTGADGFIGSHLVEGLVRRGHGVRAFVCYNSRGSRGWLDHLSPEIQKSFEAFSGDIRDPHDTERSLQGVTAVAHLAALIAIPHSYHAPASYVETNVMGTLNLLQGSRRTGVHRFLHTSTSEVYGTARSVPISESHPYQAQSPYAATKVAADQLAISFHLSYGLPVTVLRPFNTYGPRQSARAVIPALLVQILSGAEKVKVGNQFSTRDFSYVEDTVRGFVAALESEKNISGEVYNLGTGHEVTIGETARLLSEILGKPLRLETDPKRLRPEASEVQRLLADNRKAQEAFGWKPAFAGEAGLRRGLELTARWLAEPANLQEYRADQYQL